jgi:nicotinate dehydrogenase subunit B
MSTRVSPLPIEAERYELRAAPIHRFDLDRREFFKILGAGVAVFAVATRTANAQESGRGAHRRDSEEEPKDITSWLHIGEDGVVTAFTGKVEIGQNIRTSLAQSVADELHVPFESVRMVMADTALVPYDMGTFGSRTTPTMAPQLRRVANAARDLLMQEAAKEWGVSMDRLIARDAKISDPGSGRSITYAKLATGKLLAKDLPDADPITPAPDWTIAGKPIPKVDARDFVTGRHQYTTDLRPTGLLYGKVLRPASFGAKLTSLDATAAQAIPNVKIVRDGDFVGVTAPSEHAATKAIAALKANWSEIKQPSSRELFSYLKNNVEPGEDSRGTKITGSIDDGMSQAAHKLSQTYTVEYIAHTPLEPRAAVAEWKDGGITVWTGTQRPFGVREELSDAFHLPKEKIRVIVPDTGSAYGGKHTGDAAIEAARLARTAGRPVKLVWTREEEFTWAYFRPAGVIDVRGGAAADGTLTAWEFHNYNSGSSGIGIPYVVANQHVQFHETKSPLRQGSYRGLAATANHFARECAIDELAHATRMDPLEFRLKNISDARLRDVFLAASKKFGWPAKKTAEGQGFGIGGGIEKAGYVATCAEVAVDRTTGNVRVVRVVTAFECGAIVNPDGLRNQVIGANIMGLGGALFEAITFENGLITNPHFSKYRVPRFKDVPEIEAVLLDRKDIPSAGAGETPIVGIAPAIGNAIFDATGVRLRKLPMVPNGLKA